MTGPDAESRRHARRAAPLRGLVLVGDSLAAAAVICAVAGAGCLIPVVLGLYLFPPVVAAQSRLADRARRHARQWSAVPVQVPVRQWLRPARPGLVARTVLCRQIIGDPTFWRECRWALVDPFTGSVLAAVPFSLIVYGIFGALVQPFVWQVIDRAGGHNWYAMVRVDSWLGALLAVPVGVALGMLGGYSGPRLLRTHAQLTRQLLGPGRTLELTRRVEHLAGTRAEAVDSSAAELRRIERDLHDGAQARLVATGMSLGEAERLMDRDPDSARALVAAARENSSRALQEIRDLVRGIHPPVLADRGLPDAVRALALDSSLDVAVDARLPGRLPSPVESAAYFAVNELLANVTKHAGTGTASVGIALVDGALRVLVTDDGQGGADPSAGTGLRGLQRRLAAFDGTLRVDSPAGGPTVIELGIPCGS
jgi:signal transduction histidine kinase